MTNSETIITFHNVLKGEQPKSLFSIPIYSEKPLYYGLGTLIYDSINYLEHELTVAKSTGNLELSVKYESEITGLNRVLKQLSTSYMQ